MGSTAGHRAYITEQQIVHIAEPVNWVENNINFSRMTGNSSRGYLELDPHQVKPFLAMFNRDIRKVVIIAPPQVGKSIIWQAYIVTRLSHGGGYKGWVVYQDDTTAKYVNRDIMQHLMRSVPKLNKALNLPKSHNEESYNLENAVMYYSSMMKELATFSVNDIIVSEVDRTLQTLEKRQEIFETVPQRVSRYEVRKESKIIVETSPSVKANVGWQNFIEGTCEWWHLRCLKCQALIPSHQIDGVYKNGQFYGGLQWETDANGEIIENSLRLHCLECNHPHKESHWREMNEQGDYLAERHGLTTESYQFGGLAGFRSRTWLGIAKARRKLKRNNTYVQQLSFDNNHRGLPHQKRSKITTDKLVQTALKHRALNLPDPNDIAIVLISADTQKTHWVYCVFAVDRHMNIWVEKIGKAKTKEKMEDIWQAEYFGKQADMMMIDRGGHRKDEVVALINENPGMIAYIGNSRKKYEFLDDEDHLLYPTGKYWSWSENEENLVLANPEPYRVELLFKLYTVVEPAGENYLYLPSQLSEDGWEIEQITAQKPPKGYEDKNIDYVKWNAGTHDERQDDVFDCLKMGLVLIDIAKKEATWDIDMNFLSEE